MLYNDACIPQMLHAFSQIRDTEWKNIKTVTVHQPKSKPKELMYDSNLPTCIAHAKCTTIYSRDKVISCLHGILLQFCKLISASGPETSLGDSVASVWILQETCWCEPNLQLVKIWS